MEPKICIATPVGSSHVHSRYCTSLFRMGRHLQENGVESVYWTIQASDIPFQRDVLADAFLTTPDCSHLLFIDSDMEFEPSLAAKLLSFKKEFVGTIYASRKIDLLKLSEASAGGLSFKEASALAYDFHFSGGKMEFEGGLCTTQWIGLGFTLISRKCFEQIEARCPIVTYPFPTEQGRTLRGFFRQFIEPSGAVVSEDLSFCRRVRDSGMEIYAYYDAKVGHVGEFVYGTTFSELMRAQSRPVTSPAARIKP